jgi:hypothetical protein
MVAKANALKDKEYKKMAMMKANELRANVKLKKMREIMARPARDDGDDGEGLRTPRVGPISRIGTPMLGGTPRFAAAEFDDDVERGLSSRGASQVRLVR